MIDEERFIVQNDILPGQVTMLGIDLYMAEKRRPHVPCIQQCDLRNRDGMTRCRGFCFRWSNSDEIVFRHIEEWELKKEQKIVETEFARSCRVNIKQETSS